VDQITGGLVDTAGRHNDDTVRYIAPANALDGLSGADATARVTQGNKAYWDKKEQDQVEVMKEMLEKVHW
jgi:hypothetical protein